MTTYDSILARSFSRHEQKKLGCGAFFGCFIIALCICTIFKPYLGPLPVGKYQVVHAWISYFMTYLFLAQKNLLNFRWKKIFLMTTLLRHFRLRKKVYIALVYESLQEFYFWTFISFISSFLFIMSNATYF